MNKDGILGVSWNDTRDARGEHAFRRYFSASIDGGTTFLPPVAVSTEISRPFGAGNLAITPIPMTAPADIDKGAVRLLLLSSAGRWGNGGDYGGMAADPDGAFHPFWADSRTGTYQAWSARVRVSEGGAKGAQAGATRPEAPSSDPVDITSDLEFVADPTRYDPATKELTLRIRLRNKSDRPLYGPLTLTIRKFGSGLGEEGREYMPDVLNAANSKANDGATFVYDEALGSERRLPPGGLSGPVLITLRVRDPLRIPDMHLVVSGRR